MDVSAEAYARNGRRAEGLAEGMSKAQIEIAGKMLESGMTAEQSRSCSLRGWIRKQWRAFRLTFF